MLKKSIADQMAEKAFSDPVIQQNWQVHMQAFGPILEPAFVSDPQSRVHLCAALNHISGKNLNQALLKLKNLEKKLVTDADKAVYFFVVGLICEYAGKFDQMAQAYDQANQLHHKFFLPYLKVGKYSLDTGSYEKAEESYRSAIGCFAATGLTQKDKRLLGSAYTNLASSLLMMHRREEAEAALETSKSLCPEAPGRSAVLAALYALKGEMDLAQEHLSILKDHAPEAYEPIRKSVEKIGSQTDPKFFEVPVEDEKIAAFYRWLSDNTKVLKRKLDRKDYEPVIDQIASQLLKAFPFLEEPPYVALGKNDKGYVIQLKDLYAVGITAAYEKLLAACPEDLKDRWMFDIIH